MEFKGSRTENNLMAAFAGESQARNRYTYFASQARKEGYVQIADIFEETANQEREHAQRFFAQLQGGEVQIHASFPAGAIASTAQNLKASAGGEHFEWSDLYPSFAGVAREEGFNQVAVLFNAICVAEKQHEKLFLGLLANVEAAKVFVKDQVVVWRCRNCGYLHTNKEAPGTCPACAHPQAHFELLAENW